MLAKASCTSCAYVVRMYVQCVRACMRVFVPKMACMYLCHRWHACICVKDGGTATSLLARASCTSCAYVRTVCTSLHAYICVKDGMHVSVSKMACVYLCQRWHACICVKDGGTATSLLARASYTSCVYVDAVCMSLHACISVTPCWGLYLKAGYGNWCTSMWASKCVCK
jgi:hypothetical protein